MESRFGLSFVRDDMIAPIVIRYVQSVSNRRHHVGAFEARSEGFTAV
jgi:hypothetical protein